MDSVARSLEQLAEALHALALAVGPSAPPEPEDAYPDMQEPPPPTASTVLRHVHARPRYTLRALPVQGFKRWPRWGTEHVMSCSNKGCRTCARLQKTPMEALV